LPWSGATKTLVGVAGLAIVLVVVGLLNTRTPSGRVTVVVDVVAIAPVVGGLVTSVPVKQNVPITKGTVLFEIDKVPFQAIVDDAKESFALAQITYDRKQTLLKKGNGVVTMQSVDDSRATLVAAQARLTRAQYDLEKTVVTAPTDGMVTSLRLSPGDQARPLSPVMPFIRTNTLRLIGVFAQNGINEMPPGTPVRMVFSRVPGKIFDSKVVAIAPGTSSGQVAAGGNIIGAADIGGTQEALVSLEWPDDLDRNAATAGSVGSATAFGANAGAMGVLANVLLYVKMIGTYL
jgi:RND family efflux transporter MFP subunit